MYLCLYSTMVQSDKTKILNFENHVRSKNI